MKQPVRRLVLLLLAAALALGALAACAPEEAGSSPSPSPSQAEESRTPTKVTDEGYVEEREGYTATTHWVTDDTDRIFGLFYKPEGFEEGKTYPLVLMSHGIGVTHEDFDQYVSYFMELGVVCYAFDYPGGSMQSKSRGDVKEMSIMTEKAALLKVLADVTAQDFVDADRVVLMGASQGGAVAGLTAVEAAGQIRGEILLYPALCILDNIQEEYDTLEEIPDTINVRGLNLGKVYYEDIWGMDMSAEVARYTGPVLLIHGTADSAVPYSYSEAVVEQFASARLVTVPDGEHGFTDEQVEALFPEIEGFLTELGMVP